MEMMEEGGRQGKLVGGGEGAKMHGRSRIKYAGWMGPMR